MSQLDGDQKRKSQMRKVYSRYYESFPKFKTAIMGCINATQSPENKSLKPRLGRDA
jgi:hypothetical protein